MDKKYWHSILEVRSSVDESIWHTISRWGERISSIFYRPKTTKKLQELLDIKKWLHDNLEDLEYERFVKQIEKSAHSVQIKDEYGSPSESEYDSMVHEMLSMAKKLKSKIDSSGDDR
jgi:myosin heavy subunit